MPLTDAKVRALKPRSAPYKVSDAEGLHLLVPTSGSKLWRLAYRFHGKQKSLALGKYPLMSLLDARKERDHAKRLIATGTDPGASRKIDKQKRAIAAANTFEAVANEWFADREERWVKTYSSRLRSRLDEDLLPILGKRPIGQIEPFDVLTVVRGIERRDAIEMAKRVMQMAGAIFRYGVATARCPRDPTQDLKGALKPAKPVQHRTALPAKELPAFMAALDRYDGDALTKLALKLIVLTFVRTAELRLAKWIEFEELDGREPVWRIPGERMKMRRPHLVPLSPQAVAVLKQLKRIAGTNEYVLAARTKAGVVSENTLIYAIYRMGYHSRATVHGFRSMASTVLNEAQFNRDWIEMQLAHCDSSVRGDYNAAEWLPGRRKMMCWWANFVEGKRGLRLAA